MQKVSPAAVRRVAVFCAVYLAWVYLGVLGLFLLASYRPALLMYALACGALARAGNEAVHWLYQKPRPAGPSLITKPKNLAFPSGHASFLLGVSFFLIPFVWEWGILGLAVSGAVFWARVYCGVHWKTDIIGSVLVALAAWFLLFLAYAL